MGERVDVRRAEAGPQRLRTRLAKGCRTPTGRADQGLLPVKSLHEMPESSAVRRPPFSIRRAAVIAVAAAVALPVALSACGDDGRTGDTARFCELVQDNLAALRADPTTADEIDGLIDLWTDVGQRAPLAIEPDWSAHILLFETARDSDDQEEILARMYATEQSSVAVAAWLQDNCAVDFGPVATVVEQVTTTIASSTSAPA